MNLTSMLTNSGNSYQRGSPLVQGSPTPKRPVQPPACSSTCASCACAKYALEIGVLTFRLGQHGVAFDYENPLTLYSLYFQLLGCVDRRPQIYLYLSCMLLTTNLTSHTKKCVHWCKWSWNHHYRRSPSVKSNCSSILISNTSMNAELSIAKLSLDKGGSLIIFVAIYTFVYALFWLQCFNQHVLSIHLLHKDWFNTCLYSAVNQYTP